MGRRLLESRPEFADGVGRVGALFAILFLSASGSVTIHLEASPPFFRATKAGLLRERPALEFSPDARGADLSLKIDRRGDAWLLVVFEGDRALETRHLGKTFDAAVRLAVLLSLRRIAELESRPPKPPPLATIPTATTATVAAVADQPAATTTATIARRRVPVTSVIEPPPPIPEETEWELDLSATLISWTAPRAVRPGLSAAFFRRLPTLSLGLRLLAVGLCCTIHGDGIDADTTFLGIFAEGRYRAELGPLGFEAVTAFGPVADLISARVQSEVFAGGGTERKSAVTFGARVGLSIDFALSRTWTIVARGGIYGLARDFSVQLPEALRGDRAALERGQVLPFLEVGVLNADF